jgi:hypothetical protein
MVRDSAEQEIIPPAFTVEELFEGRRRWVDRRLELLPAFAEVDAT